VLLFEDDIFSPETNSALQAILNKELPYDYATTVGEFLYYLNTTDYDIIIAYELSDTPLSTPEVYIAVDTFIANGGYVIGGTWGDIGGGTKRDFPSSNNNLAAPLRTTSKRDPDAESWIDYLNAVDFGTNFASVDVSSNNLPIFDDLGVINTANPSLYDTYAISANGVDGGVGAGAIAGGGNIIVFGNDGSTVFIGILPDSYANVSDGVTIHENAIDLFTCVQQAGFFLDGSVDNCVQCGGEVGITGSECIPCEAGFYSPAGTCIVCDGDVSSDGTSCSTKGNSNSPASAVESILF
jgi:hypothetical protein